MKKYLPGLVCGFGAAVFLTVPGLKGLGCCLIIPVSSLLSVFLYKRTDKSVLRIEAVTAVGFGFVTGVVAAFSLPVLISLLLSLPDLMNLSLLFRRWNPGLKIL